MTPINQVKITRSDELGETIKIFNDAKPYEKLEAGEIVEVEMETGEIRDYIVVDTKWDFGHFGNMLNITIKPTVPKFPKMPIVSGELNWDWAHVPLSSSFIKP